MGDQRDRRVLVVEDEEDLRYLTTAYLTDAGYSVACVSNGEEAFAYLKGVDSPPALIVLDLAMPIMDGLQFLSKRDQEPKMSEIPLIVFSNDIPARMRLRTNVADCVRKTAGRKPFVDAVVRALERNP